MNTKITFENSFIKLLLLFLFTYLVIYYSFSFFPILEQDSFSYLNNESIRLSIYPLLIDILQNDYQLVIFFQISYLSLSIVALIYGLFKININKISIIIFYLLVVANIYYTSFSKTILTECIYFASINFCIFFFLIRNFIEQKYVFYIFFGIFIGLIASIRHEGFIISFIILLFFILKNKLSSSKLLLLLVSLSLMPLLENVVFYSKHQERSSVLDKSIFGKIFMLSAYHNKSKNNEFTAYINILSDKSENVNIFLEDLNNPFLKLNLFADYQVVAQYQIKNILNDEEKKILKKFEDKENEILFLLIKENPIIFLKHTLYNYFSLWMPGGKQIFLKDFNYEIPFSDLLKKSQGSINEQNNIILLSGLMFFVLLFFLFMVIGIIFIYKFLQNPNYRNESSLVIFLVSNIYLVLISFVNVATPRYMMPIYPLMLLFLALQFKKSKGN